MNCIYLLKEENFMRNTKKILAGVCALSFCMSAAACGDSSSTSGGSNDGTTTTTSVSYATLNESAQQAVSEATSDLEKKELANKELKFLSHWDINPAEGNTIGADIQMFKDVYGGYFTYMSSTWDTRYTDLATAVMSSDAPDFFSAMDMDGFPKGAMRAMFQPIDDYIDLNSELWAPAKAVNDNFVYKGKHYVAAIQAQPDIVVIYNTKTIADNQLEDPADLYYKGEWTFDKFAKMCNDFTDAENEIYALDGWWYSQTLGHMAGKAMISMENGEIKNNLDDPDIAKVQEALYEQLGKNNVMYDLAANGWSIRGGVTGQGCGSGETLFYPCGLWGIEGLPEAVSAFGDVEAGEIMFVPIPKFTADSKHYMTARDDGYFLCKGAPNPEGWAAFMNCRMTAKNKLAEVDRQNHIDSFKWNEDMLNMRDECFKVVNENPVFNFTNGVSDDLASAMNNITQGTLLTGGGAKSWTEIVNENKETIDFWIEDANASLKT
jgi:hypothetical protein